MGVVRGLKFYRKLGMLPEIMDLGEYCDGSGGYALGEVNEADLYVSLIKWWPYCDFDAKPVLTVDQVIGSINKAEAEAKIR